jgi:hypothetical protein
VAVLGALSEVALISLMERRLGFLGEPYHQGAAGNFGRLGKGLLLSGAAVMALGGRVRPLAATGGALILGGAACTRWSIFKAGSQSARDPRYTVIPQRERLDRRAEAAESNGRARGRGALVRSLAARIPH